MEIGWERSNRKHFDEIVENYDKIRWEYPDKLYKDIFDYAAASRGKKVLEIGAGTGKSTARFLNAGFDVTAVEIGANMTEFLRDKFEGHRDFRVINEAFEDVSLTDGSFDLIYAASAFHWVDAEIGCPKVFRLLSKTGVFALFRNNLIVPASGDAFYDEIQEVYKKYYHQPYQRPLRKTKEDFEKPSEISKAYGFEDLKQYGFSDTLIKQYDAPQAYSADDYMLLLDTFADHRSLPEDKRTALYAGIKKVIEKHGGYYNMAYVSHLYMGRK